jgi:hypothetical protein
MKKTMFGRDGVLGNATAANDWSGRAVANAQS